MIREVIRDTDTPSWLPSVPYNFGHVAAGHLKADEWRTLTTVYFPISLVAVWGEGSAHSTPELASSLRRILDHTMALVFCSVNCMFTSYDAQPNACVPDLYSAVVPRS